MILSRIVELNRFLKNKVKFEITNPTESFRIEKFGGEEKFTEMILSELKKSDVFYDIGANVGLVTIHSGFLAQRVVSFEPDPEFRSRLELNIKLNNLSNIQVIPWAVSDCQGESQFFTDGVGGKSPCMKEVGSRNKIIVQSKAIDIAIISGEIPIPNVIKIDIEGAEFLALNGMKSLLMSANAPRKIFIELHPDFLPLFDTNVQEVENLFANLGYIRLTEEVRYSQFHAVFEKVHPQSTSPCKLNVVQGLNYSSQIKFANLLAAKELFADAEAKYKTILDLSDIYAEHHATVSIQLAKCYISQQKYHDATNLLSTLANLDGLPSLIQFQIQMMIGETWLQLADQAKAADAFRKAGSLQGISSEDMIAANKAFVSCSLFIRPTSSKVTYATVRDYNRFLDELPQITYTSGDLKNFQRPWIVDTIVRQLPHGGRLLEIGADKCELADLLQKKGYDVWVVDIFDEFGGGVARFEETKQKFPNLTIMRGYFHEIEGVPQQCFDAIYSCSVIEHTPVAALPATFEKIFASLSNGGVSIHAIDFTVEGAVLENYVLANEVLRCCSAGISAEEIGRQALADVDTFFLSAAGHYQWRKFLKKEYDEYPYRKVTSLNIVTRKGSMAGISMQGNR